MSDSMYLYVPISVTVSIFTVSGFIFLTLTPNSSFLFTAIPQNIISPIHCIGCTAHLKTLLSHFWTDVLPCHYDPHWLLNTLTLPGLYTYLNTWIFTVLSQMVLMVLRIFNTCFNTCVLIHGLVSLSSWLFLWFLICRLVQVLVLSLVVNL